MIPWFRRGKSVRGLFAKDIFEMVKFFRHSIRSGDGGFVMRCFGEFLRVGGSLDTHDNLISFMQGFFGEPANWSYDNDRVISRFRPIKMELSGGDPGVSENQVISSEIRNVESLSMFLVTEPVMGMVTGGNVEVHVVGNFASFICSSVHVANNARAM